MRRTDASPYELSGSRDVERAVSDARWAEHRPAHASRARTQSKGAVETWRSVPRNTGSAPGEPRTLAESNAATRGKLEPCSATTRVRKLPSRLNQAIQAPYLRCDRPLIDEVDRIRRTITRNDIDYWFPHETILTGIASGSLKATPFVERIFKISEADLEGWLQLRQDNGGRS
jgi:hypothetical protein